ncbi:MAG TPA: VWA domain-containing protein [Thermoanaerobaculia bacterium]|nr:VWA domain-containing protein [Thermoanaerobaculia bacterium]
MTLYPISSASTASQLLPRLLFVVGAVLGLTLAPGRAHAAAVEVLFLSPSEATPLFGTVDLAVNVRSDEPVSKVEFTVDGKEAGVLRKPPFRLQYDVGQENVSHRIQVVATTASGAVATTERTSPPVIVNEEINVALRTLFVTVVGEDGKRVLDLTRDDFVVRDNGVEQKLVTFERGEIPFNAVLLMDTSESMRGARLEASRAGVRSFLHGMKDVDEASLVLFSDQLLAATPFHSEPKPLEAVLTHTNAEGGTAINDHLYLALKLLDGQVGRGVIVLFSDGTDVQSAIPMQEVLWKERRSQSLLYWVQLNEEGSRRTSISSAWRDFSANDREFRDLQRAVIESGGHIEAIDSISGVEGAFKSILAELRDQYVLGFYPSNSRHDGKWHEVQIRIPTRSGLHLRARGGYIDY